MFRNNWDDLEGRIEPMRCVGFSDFHSKLEDTNVNTLNNPAALSEDETRTLIAENHYLKQVIYHKATHKEEEQYSRYKRLIGQNISTSSIAQAVNRIADKSFNVGYKKTVKMPQQFVYRLMYDQIDFMFGAHTIRWDDRPDGMSKLKWLWRRDLLWVCPIVLRMIETFLHILEQSDSKKFGEMMKAVQVWESRKSGKRQLTIPYLSSIKF
jgi:hypothetical protein